MQPSAGCAATDDEMIRGTAAKRLVINAGTSNEIRIRPFLTPTLLIAAAVPGYLP